MCRFFDSRQRAYIPVSPEHGNKEKSPFTSIKEKVKGSTTPKSNLLYSIPKCWGTRTHFSLTGKVFLTNFSVNIKIMSNIWSFCVMFCNR